MILKRQLCIKLSKYQIRFWILQFWDRKAYSEYDNLTIEYFDEARHRFSNIEINEIITISGILDSFFKIIKKKYEIDQLIRIIQRCWLSYYEYYKYEWSIGILDLTFFKIRKDFQISTIFEHYFLKISRQFSDIFIFSISTF